MTERRTIHYSDGSLWVAINTEKDRKGPKKRKTNTGEETIQVYFRVNLSVAVCIAGSRRSLYRAHNAYHQKRLRATDILWIAESLIA